jgi:hypothetical protein
MAVATVFTDNMALITGNTGGAVQTLPPVTVFDGKVRQQYGRIVLASQASGTVFGVARIPLYGAIKSIDAITDTSLGSTTIEFGDANNATLYAAAATLTATQTLTRMGPLLAQTGAPLTSGYDCITGNLVTPFMPQKVGEGGAMYEDIEMTTAAAALPASGNLVIIVEYTLD